MRRSRTPFRTLFLALLALGPGLVAAAAGGWVPDDYPRALAEAKARHLPLLVDAWAPW